MVFWYLALVSVGAGVLSIAGWQPIRSDDWKWLAAIGVSGALGQYWLTDAFRRAPASVVGPFEYTAILWAFLIDWLFWSSNPSVSLVIGAGVVIASGIFVILDERRLSEIELMRGAPVP
jgi:drug/metabolite transporter (DMT)-like permease